MDTTNIGAAIVVSFFAIALWVIAIINIKNALEAIKEADKTNRYHNRSLPNWRIFSKIAESKPLTMITYTLAPVLVAVWAILVFVYSLLQMFNPNSRSDYEM